MAVTELNSSNIETTLESNDIVLIDFWAPWCGPCKAFKPIFSDAAERHPEATFVTCNTDEESELAAMFRIRSIPTLYVFRDGIPVFAQPGMLPAEALDELVTKVRELDMDEVRAKATAAAASA